MTIADFVRQQCKQHKMTQRDLDASAGVGICFVRESDGGKKVPYGQVQYNFESFVHKHIAVPSKDDESHE